MENGILCKTYKKGRQKIRKKCNYTFQEHLKKNYDIELSV